MSAAIAKQSSTDALLLAPPEVRAELNRTYTQYQYLGSLGSLASFAASIGFFIQDYRVKPDDVNKALRACRNPEKMREYKFASDLMADFASFVCVFRDRRIQEEHEEAVRVERMNRPTVEMATREQIAELTQKFASGFGMH